MKLTTEERVKERISGMKDTVKLVKQNLPGWKNTPKWASMYADDVSFLLKELAKAVKVNV